MTALRPVIVVRSSVQNPATFACDKRLFQVSAAPLLCGRSGSNRIPLPTHAQRLLVLFWHRVEPAAAAPIDARTDARKFGRIGQLSTGMDTTQAQTILSNIGLLDPPADGALGPVTRWALSEFCSSAGVPFDGATITDAVAQTLAAAAPLPLAPGNDLAGRIVSAVQGGAIFIARHKNCLNIVYVEVSTPTERRTEPSELLIPCDA